MKSLLMILSIALLSPGAFAQDAQSTFQAPAHEPAQGSELKPHVGVLAGVAQPEGSYDTGGEFGIDVGFQPYVPFGFGAELNRYTSAGGRQTTLERTTLFAKATYNLGGDTPVIRYSYFGLGTGPVFESNGTHWALAPVIGFDIPIAQVGDQKSISLGATAKYAFISGDATDALSAQAIMKYWY
jgi:hypothetical protein